MKVKVNSITCDRCGFADAIDIGILLDNSSKSAVAGLCILVILCFFLI